MITLAASRKAQIEARRLLAEGVDPSEEKKRRKELTDATAIPSVLNPFKALRTFRSDSDNRFHLAKIIPPHLKRYPTAR